VPTTSRFEVVRHVATPAELTADPPLQVIPVPFTEKVTDPVGAVGESEPGAATVNVAVNVTGVLRAAGVVGEMVSVGISSVMVWFTVEAVDEV
jgi:hypothetical protein